MIFRAGSQSRFTDGTGLPRRGKGFQQFVHLAIQIDNLMRSRRPGSRSATSSRNLCLPRYYSHMTADSSEPMQLTLHQSTKHPRLTEEEKERRRSQRLCLYCGEAGHFRQNCPHRPINRDNAAVSLTLNCLNSKSCVTVPIEFFVNGKSFSTICSVGFRCCWELYFARICWTSQNSSNSMHFSPFCWGCWW